MRKLGRALGGFWLLAALVVPVNAHAAAGCQTNPEFTNCNYISHGGDINYVGIDAAGGSISIFRDYATKPPNCANWGTAGNKACLLVGIVLPSVTHGGTPVEQGTITSFHNQTEGTTDSPRLGDKINVSSAGDLGNGLGRSSGVLYVADAA